MTARGRRWMAGLQTFVQSLTYDFDAHVGRLALPPDCCTDMSGAIQLFARLDADVQRIEVFAGGMPDITYQRTGQDWHALNRRGAQ